MSYTRALEGDDQRNAVGHRTYLAWLRWRYIKVSDRGSLRVDFRWYVATGAWQRAMDALRAY